MWKATVVFAAVVLAGCQTTQNQPKPYWMRIDGKQMTGHPKLEKQFKIDSLICQGETAKAYSTQQPVYYSGLGGAIAAAQINNQREQALLAVVQGCMAEKGYLLKFPEKDGPMPALKPVGKGKG